MNHEDLANRNDDAEPVETTQADHSGVVATVADGLVENHLTIATEYTATATRMMAAGARGRGVATLLDESAKALSSAARVLREAEREANRAAKAARAAKGK